MTDRKLVLKVKRDIWNKSLHINATGLDTDVLDIKKKSGGSIVPSSPAITLCSPKTGHKTATKKNAIIARNCTVKQPLFKRGFRRVPIESWLLSERVLTNIQTVIDELPSELHVVNVPCSTEEKTLTGIGAFTFPKLLRHIADLRVENTQRLMRPVIQKLMQHPRNNGIFNTPVDPIALNIPDYLSRIPKPMDLGTVKSRLLAGEYGNIESCAADVALVFSNAISYNRSPEHVVHQIAKVMEEEFVSDMVVVRDKLLKETERKVAHDCTLCQGACCPLCDEKCLKYEPPVLICYGTCGQRIKRNSIFFVSTDGCKLWCQRCYTNLPSVLGEEGALLKKDLLKRKLDEEVAEPWAQCDFCGRWVHQICALFNDRFNAAEMEGSPPKFCCPLCKLEDGLKPIMGRLHDICSALENGTLAKSDADDAGVPRLSPKAIPEAQVHSACGSMTETWASEDLRSERLRSVSLDVVPEHFNPESQPETPPMGRRKRTQSLSVMSDSSSRSVRSRISQTEAQTDAVDENSCGMEGVESSEEPQLEDNGSASDLIENTEAANGRSEEVTYWRAASLPTCKLSDFLESVTRDRLVCLGCGSVAETITVRVVSNVDHYLEVPDVICANLVTSSGSRVPQYIPYRQKCILLFQNIDGVDVVLFCLYVHEFDNNTPEPNKSRVYIAYVDSVEYFRPREARTAVYHEIMSGYLMWAQRRGFQQCQFWACPPQRGDNFIFWCHPPHQRTPTRDRLNAWYAEMLHRASRLGVIEEVGTMWSEFFSSYSRRDDVPTRTASRNSLVNVLTLSKSSSNASMPSSSACAGMDQSNQLSIPCCPPVFDGDFWVNECLRVHGAIESRAKGSSWEDKALNHRRCRDLLKSLMSKPFAKPFCQPVDPVALQIPSYPLIISSPMDLGTIREKLRVKQYVNVLEFLQDIRLTFRNAMIFNPVGHPVHVMAQTLLREFMALLKEALADNVEFNNLMSLSLPVASVTDSEQFDNVLATFPLDHCNDGGLMATTISTASDLQVEPAESPRGGQSNQDAGGNATWECHSSREEGSSSSDTDNHRHSPSPTPLQQQGPGDSQIDSAECSEAWAQRPLFRGSSSQSRSGCPADPLAGTPMVLPQLGLKGACSLMFELSKNVNRLKDDLFVVTFARPDKICNASYLDTADKDPTLDSRRGSVGSYADYQTGAKTGRGKGKVAALIKKSASEPIELLSPQSLAHLRDIKSDTSDPDESRECAFLDCRHTFLELCQFRHYQFDTLRRAKHSSLLLLYHLFNSTAEHLRPLCLECHKVIDTVRWHCDQCSHGIDLCNDCATGGYQHDHPLIPVRVTFK